MGIRVIKTALAALLAIYTAYYLQLASPLSAGLLAVIGVEVTRMKGLQSALVRLAAAVLGLFFASVIFLVFGFHIWAVSLFILIGFPVMSRLGLKDGIVTSSVVVFHLFAEGEVSEALFLNEALLLLTGLGWATVVNLVYMPREDHRLEELRRRAEEKLTDIFRELAATLRDPSRVWNGEQLLDAESAIEEGARLAELSRENRFWRYQAYWGTYFDMRARQFETVGQMTAIIAFVYEKRPQGELIADLLDILSEDIKSDVYTGVAERELAALERRFRSMPLPQTREEFEVRAALLQLCREVDRFLSIAKRWKKKSFQQP